MIGVAYTLFHGSFAGVPEAAAYLEGLKPVRPYFGGIMSCEVISTAYEVDHEDLTCLWMYVGDLGLNRVFRPSMVVDLSLIHI